jgi:hypothetical protein
LCAFENKKLEEHSIVVYGNAPFRVVIRDGQFRGSPGTMRQNLETTSRRRSSHGPVGRICVGRPTKLQTEVAHASGLRFTTRPHSGGYSKTPEQKTPLNQIRTLAS